MAASSPAAASSLRKPYPASTVSPASRMSPSPSFTNRGSCTGAQPRERNQSRYAPASAARSGYWNRTPSTLPSITVAPLAANTMSGSCGCGSMVCTVCPSRR